MDTSTSSSHESEDSSIYNSASDGSFFLINGNDNVNNSTIINENNSTIINENNSRSNNEINNTHSNNNENLSTLKKNNDLYQSEGSDNLEEVDPKSNLAIKTIFKTDNPNLSIIEINDSSLKTDEESVYLIESDDDEEHKEKVRSILHSSKQKLNVMNNTINNTNNVVNVSFSTASTSAASLVITTATTTLPTEASTSTITIASLSPTPISSSSSSSSSSTSTSTLSSNTTNITGDETATKIKTTPEKRVIKVYDTIDEFEKNLPKTVKILSTPYGSRVYLVGTAHFSEESQDDVSFVIRNVKPDIVMVELCTSRIHILRHDEKFLLEETKNFNLTKIRNIIRTNGFINGIFFILLLQMSAKLAKDIGMAPGGEFRRAYDEVQKLSGCTLHLGDRPINITLQRALHALSLWQTIKLVWRLTSTESINSEDIEECKEQDLLEKLLQEMAGEFPAFSDVFVKERDLYLCHSLQIATLPITQSNGLRRPVNVVGVVGIGHTAGIVKNWMKVETNNIKDILEIPPSSLSKRIFQYTIKIGFYGLITYGVYKYLRPKFKY